jgi:hypothetical protein
MDYLGIIAVTLLFAALTFSIGYHLGFEVGLDTKVTWVGEKYTMKVTGKGGKK